MKQHSMHCVCKGRNWIWQETFGTTGPNNTPIAGSKKIDCPFGDLRVNDIHPAPATAKEEEWDI